jgi:hypothetical protein
MGRYDTANGSYQGPAGNVERHALSRRAVKQQFGVRDHAVEHRPRLLKQPRPACGGLHEHHPAAVGVDLDAADHLRERRARGARPLPLLQRARHPHERPLGHRPVGRQQTLFAVGELLVERRARDPRPGADLGDAQALVAELPRELDDRVDQPLALGALRGDTGHRHTSALASVASRGTASTGWLRHRRVDDIRPDRRPPGFAVGVRSIFIIAR